jgi:hypothetical protein
MSGTTHLVLSGVAAAITILVGTLCLVVPVDRETRTVYHEIAMLERVVGHGPEHALVLEHLAAELTDARRRCDEWRRRLPTSPGIRGLTTRLTDFTDGREVRKRAVRRAGEAYPTLPGTALALPLAVDLEASFDDVFAVLREAERAHEPVRVRRLRVTSRGPGAPGEPPMLAASLDLEIVFDPTRDEEFVQ